MCSGRSGTEVRPALPGDIGFVRDTLLASWGSTVIAVHGELIEAMEQEALVAWRDGRRVGLATYRRYPDELSWELVSLDATAAGAGVGSALLEGLEDRARAAGARRI